MGVELEAALRDAASAAAWGYYDDALNRVPNAEVHLPPSTTLQKLLESDQVHFEDPPPGQVRQSRASLRADGGGARVSPDT